MKFWSIFIDRRVMYSFSRYISNACLLWLVHLKLSAVDWFWVLQNTIVLGQTTGIFFSVMHYNGHSVSGGRLRPLKCCQVRKWRAVRETELVMFTYLLGENRSMLEHFDDSRHSLRGEQVITLTTTLICLIWEPHLTKIRPNLAPAISREL